MNLRAIKENIGGFIVAILLLSSWSAYNYKLRLDLSDKKDEFERYQSGINEKLRERELTVSKRELNLDSMQKQISELQAQLNIATTDVNKKLEAANDKELKTNKLLYDYQPHILQTKEEYQIKILMSKFSALGVNVSEQPACNDKEAVSKYNKAISILNEIATRANSVGVYNKYEWFTNRGTRYGSCKN